MNSDSLTVKSLEKEDIYFHRSNPNPYLKKNVKSSSDLNYLIFHTLEKSNACLSIPLSQISAQSHNAEGRREMLFSAAGNSLYFVTWMGLSVERHDQGDNLGKQCLR